MEVIFGGTEYKVKPFSDRIGPRLVFLTSHLMAIPTLLGVIFLRGNWVFPATFLAGFFVLATLPVGVALAQDLAPKGKSMAASLMMGFALGIGGILSPLVGKLSDLFTINTVLSTVAFVPLLSLVLISFLPPRVRAGS